MKEELAGVGAVQLEGPKWCGKTSTAEQIAESVIYMNNPATKEMNKIIAQTDPVSLLKGETPRLIDEWQISANQIWDATGRRLVSSFLPVLPLLKRWVRILTREPGE